MMGIVRFLEATAAGRRCVFLHGARTRADIIFATECSQLAESRDWLDYRVSLTQPDDAWTGGRGRIDLDAVRASVPSLTECRFFLCGPNAFMDTLRDGLLAELVPADRIHTEQFHATKSPVTT